MRRLRLVEPVDEFADAAPIEFQRDQARGYLERLVGQPLVGLKAEDAPEACDDCGHVHRRYRYGRFGVCLGCALMRRHVATRRAA